MTYSEGLELIELGNSTAALSYERFTRNSYWNVFRVNLKQFNFQHFIFGSEVLEIVETNDSRTLELGVGLGIKTTLVRVL